MYKKLDTIHKTPTCLAINNLKPLFEFKDKTKDGGLTREQKLEIKAGNKYFKGKLSRQSSYYSLDQWKKDFEKSQNFKKNICEFPCIDFHKTRQDFSGGGFNYNQKMNFNDLISDAANNYFSNTRFKKFKQLWKNNDQYLYKTEV